VVRIQLLRRKVVYTSTTPLLVPYPVRTVLWLLCNKIQASQQAGMFCGWFFICFVFFLRRGETLIASLCFYIVYPCHLSHDSDSDPQSTRRRNASQGQSLPHPVTVSLQGWESNSFSVPVLAGQSSWQDVSAYCNNSS